MIRKLTRDLPERRTGPLNIRKTRSGVGMVTAMSKAPSITNEADLIAAFVAGRQAEATATGRRKPRGETARIIEQGRQARALLIQRHLPLAATIARSYRQSGVELQDLISEGIVGLIEAVDRFDHTKGVPLGMWARNWIKRSIERNGMVNASIIRMPVAALYDRNELNTTRVDMTRELGRAPTVPELAERTGLTQGRVQDLLTAPRRDQMPDESPHDDSMTSAADRAALASGPAADTGAVHRWLLDKADVILAPLPMLERRVLALMCGAETGDPFPVAEIAAYLGLSVSDINTAQKSAAARLRHPHNQLPVD